MLSQFQREGSPCPSLWRLGLRRLATTKQEVKLTLKKQKTRVLERKYGASVHDSVLLFPAVKTPLAVTAVCMSAVLSGCYSYHPLVPAHNIPAGPVIQESDFGRTGRVWILLVPDNYAEDRSRVIGHKALRQVPGGLHLRESDISPFAAKSKLAE